MEFFMPMEKLPSATGQEKGYSSKTGTYYENDRLKAARRKINSRLAPYRPEKPLEGPLMLTVKWCYPASEKHPGGTWKTTKPDTDNLLKVLKDEMTHLGFWHDDAQVCSEHNDKFYNHLPGIYVAVEELEG